MRRPYRLHATFTGIRPGKHRDKFATIIETDIKPHAEKLDLLADVVCAQADPTDVLVFIDSDAFPVANIDPLFAELSHFPLIAVRRDENIGDRQPHPCFCMTTVGFWKELGGNWGEEDGWENESGALVRDVGGNLLKLLSDRNIEWKPLLRTNTVDLHPLMFGIYAHAIYHHAAGSRPPTTRQDRHRVRLANESATDAELAALYDEAVNSNRSQGKDMLAMIRAGKNR